MDSNAEALDDAKGPKATGVRGWHGFKLRARRAEVLEPLPVAAKPSWRNPGHEERMKRLTERAQAKLPLFD